jgi:hypothetical protein
LEKNDFLRQIYNKKKLKKMNNFIVDGVKAQKKWAPILDALKVTDDEKRAWMSEYAEMHQMNENVGYATLNQSGMGNVLAPVISTIPGSTWQGGGTIGSGDVAQNLLPVAMKIAAQTIGLDLVAVKPTASPRIELLFVDFKYDNAYADGIREDVDANQRPLVFKIHILPGNIPATDAALKAAIQAWLTTNSITERIGGLTRRVWVNISNGAISTTAPTYGAYTNIMEFLGFSRIDGYPMFRIYRQAGFSVGVLVPQDSTPGWDAGLNTFPQTGILTGVDSLLSGATITGVTLSSGATIQLVSLLEDHIPGFSAGWYNNAETGWEGPMTRYQDEKTYPGVIGPDVFTKSVQVGDVEISSTLKRTQIEDIKAATGMDIVQKLEGVLINELTQVISKEIVGKIRSLAEKNRVSHTAPKTAGGVSKFDLDVDSYIATLGGSGYGGAMGETTHSIQRKLIAKINNASNFIATDGRVGPAQYLVTNGNLASVIQDIAGYTINPVNAGKLNTNGQLYPMGNVGSIAIYVDPYMRWDDNQIYLGRKNSIDQPGLLFIPYLMAQSISLISEATWAPRMLIRSRYAVADIGFFPEKQFMAIKVTDSNGVLI